MIERLKVYDLTPHPLHEELYGSPLDDPEGLNELIADMELNGMLNPLVVDQENVIIAGHRRWQAAKVMGIDLIACNQLAFEDEAQRIQWLISDNTYRIKSNASKIKEARVLESMYAEVALSRKKKTELDPGSMLDSIARKEGKIVSRDKAGAAVGISARTYVDGKSALETADRLRRDGDEAGAKEIEDKLESSVHGAKLLADKRNKKPIGNPNDPHKLLYWYVPYLENMVSVINVKTKLMKKKLNNTTPSSMVMFLNNIEAMAARMRTWYVPNLKPCPVCKGTMFVGDSACTNCFQGKVGVYVNTPPKAKEEDI